QLWIATSDDQLARVDLAGRPFGEPTILPFSETGMLVPAAYGPAGAIWTATPLVALMDVSAGTLACSTLTRIDAALPLTSRRWVVARGPELSLPSGATASLPPNTAVLGGAVMAKGRTVTLLVKSGHARQLIVLSLSTGRVLRRYAIADSAVRL